MTIFAISVAAVFLFQPAFTDEVRQRRQKQWHWKILKYADIQERHVWHLLIGYFLVILLVSSTAANNLIKSSNQTDVYIAYFSVIPAVSTIFLITRILSKIGLKIIDDTNIGIFVVGIYLAEVLLEVSFGSTPFEQLKYFFSNNASDVLPAFILYVAAFVSAVIATGLDWFVVIQLMDRRL